MSFDLEANRKSTKQLNKKLDCFQLKYSFYNRNDLCCEINKKLQNKQFKFVQHNTNGKILIK